ncbi:MULTISPECIES: hypothetical protein [unclassified Anabaena]|nr:MULTISPECIES: hypothetical protein [unclassified Anabaena]
MKPIHKAYTDVSLTGDGEESAFVYRCILTEIEASVFDVEAKHSI